MSSVPTLYYDNMISYTILALFWLNIFFVAGDNDCYWNRHCPYKLHSSKTPYDTVRGDIRDYPAPDNCEAISLWTLNRHGNRNPGDSVTVKIKTITTLKSDIIQSYEAGRSHLCAQEIDEFQKWTWNDTMEISEAYLTATGYEEIFDIASRIRMKYPHLVTGSEDSFYFRSTNEQRTITSAMAFIHGLTEGSNLTLEMDEVRERDDVIRPYENCDRYQQEVKSGQQLKDELEEYANTDEYIAVQNRVQQRLGISYQLTADDVYTMYEACRFFRTWTATLQSPWCAAFTDQDLVVLEYRDDIRHYYRNGYGSWVNARLGGPVLKDFYDNFEAASRGEGKKLVSYFTHDTMMEMTFSALGLFQDSDLFGAYRNPNRNWRSSYIAAFSTNIIAVLNKCKENNEDTFKVQLFMNEKETTLCPLSGCTWEEYQDIFQKFSSSLDFCSLTYPTPEQESAPASAAIHIGSSMLAMLTVLVLC